MKTGTITTETLRNTLISMTYVMRDVAESDGAMKQQCYEAIAKILAALIRREIEGDATAAAVLHEFEEWLRTVPTQPPPPSSSEVH